MKKNNEIIYNNEVAYIIIKSKKHGTFKATIDSKNVDKIKGYTWWVAKKQPDYFIVYTQVNRKTFLLHRIILNVSLKELAVDHIDHNTMNNVEKNLRICTNAENMQNRKMTNRKNKTSNTRGVYWREDHKSWVAQVVLNKKKVFAKEFKDLNDAISAVADARKEFFTHTMN